MSIGKRIKQRREELGMSQEELAKALGVTKGAIGNYEVDLGAPKATNITKLMAVLQTDANFLFEWDAQNGADDSNVSMGFGKKIEKVMREKGITQAELSRQTGISKTTINNLIVRDSSRCSIDNFLAICDALDIEPYSFYKSYQARNPEILTKEERTLIEKYRKLNAQSKEIVTYILQKEADRDDLVPDIHMISVKTSYLPASAGHGEFLSEENLEYKDYVATPTALKADIVIPVSGDSMLPVYDDGDLLFVKRQPTIEFGEIGIFTVDGVGYVKKLGQGYLISLNPDYADIPLDGKEVYCVGKVLGKVEE